MKYVIANWKMNKTLSEAKKFFENFSFQEEKTKVLICPPFTLLSELSKKIPKNIFICAQNMYFEKSGAFTGEISPLMLKEFNIKHVLLGHSERRFYFGEENPLINKKVLSALENNLIPILCVGENLEERQANLAEKILEHQLKRCLENVVLKSSENLIIAYEPIWAISTFQSPRIKPKPALIEDIQFVHTLIRRLLIKLFPKFGGKIPIVYGGSVSSKNAKQILFLEEVQGVLVGRESLDPNSFKQIISSCP